MGHRKSVHVTRRDHFESLPSPNSTIDQISVDFRVFFPPNADSASVMDVMLDTFLDAREELMRMYADG